MHLALSKLQPPAPLALETKSVPTSKHLYGKATMSVTHELLFKLLLKVGIGLIHYANQNPVQNRDDVKGDPELAQQWLC